MGTSASPTPPSSTPGSVSVMEPSADHEYPGSRMLRHRYAYKQTSHAGFIELSPTTVLEEHQWKELLEGVPGVDHVETRPHCFLVYPTLFPHMKMEFCLTRCGHMRAGPEVPFTISAMFRDPPKKLRVEAWRILTEACAGKELLPNWVSAQYQDVRRREEISEEVPGSASTSPSPGTSLPPEACRRA